MKKIFSLLAAVLFAGSMMATTITITAASGFKSSYGSGDTFTVDEAEFWYSGVMYNVKGTPAPAAAKSFMQLRKSGSGAGEIKNNTGLALKSITIATQNDKDFTLSAGTAADALAAVEKPAGTTGTYQFVDKNGNDASCDVTIYTFDVEGNAYFDILNGANASYFAYIAIELAGGVVPPTPAVAAPVIAGDAEFTESTQVSISCETASAAIYYTLDGTDPTTNSLPYDNPFTLTETATVKAVAYDTENDEYSAVVEKTFTKVEPATPISLSEFIAAAPTTEVTLKPLTVIFASGKNTYVIDEEGIALVLYDASKTYYDGTLTAGKVLTGQKATYTIYKNQSEIIPTNTAVVSDGVAPVPTELNAAPTDEHINHFVSFKNVEATLNNSNYYIFSSVQLYGATSSLKPTVAGNYDVEGLYIVYNGTQPELIVTAIAQAPATAINNTTDEIKAFKTIENGKLVIIKNGVRYDATGAVIR